MQEEKKPIVVGIPRALLFHRYEVFWQTFFDQLKIGTVISDETVRTDLEKGSDLAIDETCLSEKIWFGHVSSLIGRCDYILVPRVAGFGKHRTMCTRFLALPDLTRTVFYQTGQRFLEYNVDVLRGSGEMQAFFKLGMQLGCPLKEIRKAWKAAVRADRSQWKQAVRDEEALLKAEGLKVMVCAHSYVIRDAYIGKPVLDFLTRNQVTVIRADVCDRKQALKKSREVSPTCGWEINREILGSAALRADKVDGIIVMSAFPCGPDAMVNEMIQRKIKNVPILNLTLDGQSGSAGIETRLESFIDIIRFRGGLL